MIHQLRAGRIIEGDWMQADLQPGYTLAIVDGPYAMGKAAWDRMSVDGLADWYRPHLARVSALLAASASVYLWNTAEGWARLDPVMREAGWTHKSLIVWEKPNGQAIKSIEVNRGWPDVTEVCGFYQREAWAPSTCAGSEIAYAAGRDDRNTARAFLASEWAAAGLRNGAADVAMGTNGMAGHYFGSSQWSLPTWDAYQKLAAYADEHGPARERPYLVLPAFWPAGGLRASYDHLRAEYEASRPAFTCPVGLSNVWSHPQVSGSERLPGPAGALHPCQKPLAFAERMILASTRPGERVLVPFGGTCREAVICEWLARTRPEEARGYDVCELNADGVDYIGPVLEQIAGRPTTSTGAAQVRLFGGAQ